jgi:ferredoxin
MPTPTIETADASWRDRLRHFHVTGRGSPEDAGSLVPLSLAGFFDPKQRFEHYPLLVSETEDGELVGPFAACVRDVLAELEGAGRSVGILVEHQTKLVWAFDRALADAGGQSQLAAIVDDGLARFLAEFKVSAEALTALKQEITRFRKVLPVDGVLLGLGEQTFVSLYRVVVQRARAHQLASFVEEAQTLVSKLADILRVDDARSPDGSNPEAVKASLGSVAGEFFETSALTSSLPKRSGSKPLGIDRRVRIAKTLDTLRTWLDQKPSASDLIVVHDGSESAIGDLEGIKEVTHSNCIATAMTLFDSEIERVVGVERAIRAARLDVVGDYDEDIHDSQLARLDWHGLAPDALLRTTPMAVMETRARLAGQSLAALSAMLRSGRPIHVLVRDREGAGVGGSLPNAVFELGYFALAHRESFVLQSSLASPASLAFGLDRMAASARPAVIVVGEPSVGLPPWLGLVSRVACRAMPSFLYDPSAGPSWAHRCDASQNPQPQRPWPTHQAAYEQSDGREVEMDLPFTFADAAALDPDLRKHFWAIPEEAWSEEQHLIADLLADHSEQPTLGLPFIWVVGDDGKLARAIVTRELAMATRDRVHSWHTLQELGGLDNEHVRRATVAAQDQAAIAAGSQREALERQHAEEIERVRAQAAADAMGRLVDVLLDLDTVPRSSTPPTATPTASASTPEAAAPAGEATTEEAVEEEDEVSFDEPWIDAPLCTTCNECTNINSRLFKYNADNQAYIADATAGTFAQLVNAAIKCPARCIHPGAPRSDDDTATEELQAKAAQFN